MVEGLNWPDRTLTQIEGDDWGEPAFASAVVTNGHRLRQKPLKEFTAEDLRFILGQQISLPVLMPMVLDYLERVDLFAGGDMAHGSLLHNALKVDKVFWQEHPQLWSRMKALLGELHEFREFIDQTLLPAASEFESAGPE